LDTYQVFFSYKRNPLFDPWHRTLADRIRTWIAFELGILDAKVFVDTSSIENGSDFPDFIAGALKNSTVIVCLFSPLYFNSPWCMTEINFFIDREKKLNLKQGSLVSCARFHDGVNYPDAFRDMQSDDFTPFANPNPHFWNSQKGADFDDVIKQFCKTLSDKIRNAPVVPPHEEEPTPSAVAVSDAPKIRRPGDYLVDSNFHPFG
jgi:hypothetical protein